MKTYPLIKIAAISAVFITAMAFSCQDHHVPDPVANCQILNQGTWQAPDWPY